MAMLILYTGRFYYKYTSGFRQIEYLLERPTSRRY